MMIIFSVFLMFGVYQGDTSEQSWSGKWFPHKPIEPNLERLNEPKSSYMGLADECDNGNNDLDYDPSVLSENCIEKWSLYKHNYSIQPVLKEFVVPPSYVPLHKCVNESIEYDERLPTFGTHRPLWAKYGEYKFLPIQRWLHNVEHGAVIMLYHPCASFYQVEKLKMLVENCLYKHIITPSKRLLSDRPLALVTWGKSLEMSVVDSSIVIEFIRRNALKGPERTFKNGQYDKMLVKSSKVVSNEEDGTLCPNYL